MNEPKSGRLLKSRRPLFGGHNNKHENAREQRQSRTKKGMQQMTDGISMNRQQLEQEHQTLRAEYEAFVQKGLRLDMSRGKPCSEQLELSMPMLQICDYMGEEGIDARNYGTLEGMPEARRFFADLLGTTPEETLVCGSSSLTMMYHMAELAMRKGF